MTIYVIYVNLRLAGFFVGFCCLVACCGLGWICVALNSQAESVCFDYGGALVSVIFGWGRFGVWGVYVACFGGI